MIDSVNANGKQFQNDLIKEYIVVPNPILESEWLALRWHMQDLLAYRRWTNIEPTVGN